jgi:predicted hydrocarbon binding protein
MADTVDALLPLSLLEAVRTVDTPEGDLETEYVPELRNKRLGLSDTVYSQIRRYTDAVRRKQRTAHDEAVALARLIGRRGDAEAVFRAAGRHLANEAYLTISSSRRNMIRVLPSIIARPLALRQAKKICARYFDGHLSRVGSSLMLDVQSAVTVDAAPRDAGCAYYEAGLRELVRLLVGGGGSVEHVRCAARGEGSCQWRVEWRT